MWPVLPENSVELLVPLRRDPVQVGGLGGAPPVALGAASPLGRHVVPLIGMRIDSYVTGHWLDSCQKC